VSFAKGAQRDISLRLSHRLERTFEQDRAVLDVATLLKSFEWDRTHGSILLVFTAPVLLPLPPGAAMVLALPLLLIAPQVVFGGGSLWLPGWLLRRSFDRAALARLSARALPFLRRIETVGRPRLLFLTGDIGRRCLGVAACVLALILVSPFPLSTLFPGLALLVLALGLMRRDGLLVLTGYALTAIAIVVVLLGLQAVRLIAHAAQRLI
jgi:hypothetical protein